MKTASPALIAFLNALRPTSDAALMMADCYTFTLASGSAVGLAGGLTLAYTDLDVSVSLGGVTFLANGPQVSGLKYKCSTGVNVDQQQITLSAWGGATLGGVTFLQALQQGVLDGAEIRRDRAFFSSLAGIPPLTPIGSVLLFKGRVASIDEIGRTTAKITVASDLTLLDIDMPRNVYAPNCIHVLYDGGCGVSRSAYTLAGTVGAGSTLTAIEWGSATANFAQGSLTFTSGANEGVTATIKSGWTGGVLLAYPLPHVPATGDAFTASWGCDHTQSTCSSKFSNLANFRGFPFVPPPQILTGPLATWTTSVAK